MISSVCVFCYQRRNRCERSCLYRVTICLPVDPTHSSLPSLCVFKNPSRLLPASSHSLFSHCFLSMEVHPGVLEKENAWPFLPLSVFWKWYYFRAAAHDSLFRSRLSVIYGINSRLFKMSPQGDSFKLLQIEYSNIQLKMMWEKIRKRKQIVWDEKMENKYAIFA